MLLSQLTTTEKRELLRDIVRRAGPVPATRLGSTCPLSSAQLGMWFLHQMEPQSGRYHIPLAVRIDGPFDIEAFRRALHQTAQQHEALRTTFRVEEGEPVQVIAPAAAVDLRVTDLQQTGREDRERHAYDLMRSECTLPFDLESGPLIRAGVIRLGDRVHFLYVVMHHIVSDGCSVKILLRELIELASAHKTGRPASLPPGKHQYRDYAAWQRAQLDSPIFRRQVDYWKGRLTDVPPLLCLPADRPRPERLSDRGARVPLLLDAATGRRFRELCAAEGVSFYAGLLAAFQTFLARFTGQETVVTGFPVANRLRREWEDVIGFFANTIALPTTVTSGTPFRTLLHSVGDQLREALANQDLPFDVLVRHLEVRRSLASHPVFQAALVVEEMPCEANVGPLRLTPLEIDTGFTKFDLTLTVRPDAGGALHGSIEYSTDLFDAPTIENMGRHFGVLVSSIVSAPDTAVEDLSMLLPEEADAIAGEWNATQRPYPRDSSVHRLFEAQARETPNATAICDLAKNVTYAELNTAANRLARALAAVGAEPGSRIAIAVPQSDLAVAAMLAILKTGGTWIALDPEDGSDRNNEILRDSGARFIITSKEHPAASRFEGISNVVLESALVSSDSEDLSWDGSGSDPAYIIYTSGSTGRPRGVLVPHRAIARLVLNTDYIDIRPSDRVAGISTLLFDVCIFEIFGALLNGAALVPISREITVSPAAFASATAAQRPTIAVFTTSVFNHLAAAVPHAFHTFRSVLVGGEAIDPRWFARLFRSGYQGRLVNAYGPSEAATLSICNVLSSWDSEITPVPIGRPIANSTAYILNSSLRPVAPGEVGEICVGGDGIALGYINDDAATRERFVVNPFAAGERLYRTGDFGRYRRNGEIEFLGRRDRQVKIRGVRIEPGEIERVLEAHPDITRAVVQPIATPAADQALAAWAVPVPGSAISPHIVQDWLRSRLPAWLVPARIFIVDALPLTRNGKLDVAALLQTPSHSVRAERKSRRMTPVESLVVEVWKRVLGLDHLDVSDDFFNAGGTSLSSIRMISEIERTIGRRIPPALILRSSTVETFAQSIEIQSASRRSRLFCIREGDAELPPVVLLHAGSDYCDILQGVSTRNAVWSLSPPAEEELRASTTMHKLASLYSDDLYSEFGSRAVIFGGYCLSGMLAFEIARQRAQQTGSSAPVILFDVPAPQRYWERSLSRIPGLARYAAWHGRRWSGLSAERKIALVRNWTARIAAQFLSGSHGLRRPGRPGNAFFNAARCYRPAPYPGKVILVRASVRPADDRYLGWDAVAASVEVVDMPCTHTDLLKGPNARLAASALAAAASSV